MRFCVCYAVLCLLCGFVFVMWFCVCFVLSVFPFYYVLDVATTHEYYNYRVCTPCRQHHLRMKEFVYLPVIIRIPVCSSQAFVCL